MRTILHSDANSFYAGVEMVYNPALRSVPLAVCGDPEARHGIVLTKNQLAKRYGVATGEPIWQAREKCPNLHVVRPNPQLYVHFSKMLRDIYSEYTDRVEPFGLDEAWLDVTACPMSGAAIADELRRRAKDELGLTLSVGVSFNKIFAKLGSDMKKPDATTVISIHDYREKVWPLPVRDLLYVGPATEAKLHRRNIYTIGDIARSSRAVLHSALGKCGTMLWSFANGLDTSPVTPVSDEALIKSIGNSTTTPRDIATEDDAKMVIYLLSECVAERLREHGLCGATVNLYVRDCELHSFTCQQKLPQSTAIAAEISREAMALFRKHYSWSRPVRSMGVTMTTLSPLNADCQLSMFPDIARERRLEFENAIADIRRRFGHFAIQRAVFIANPDIGVISPKDDHAAQPFSMHAV